LWRVSRDHLYLELFHPSADLCQPVRIYLLADLAGHKQRAAPIAIERAKQALSAFEKAAGTLMLGNKPSDFRRGTGADDETVKV
jgi:hypothetical protein